MKKDASLSKSFFKSSFCFNLLSNPKISELFLFDLSSTFSISLLRCDTEAKLLILLVNAALVT